MDNQPLSGKRNPTYKAQHLAYHETVSNESLAINNTSVKRSATHYEATTCRTDVLILAAIVTGCTLVILLAVTYLTFLWFQGPTITAWTTIILSNWTATSVAICGVAIRWMSGFQMALCTSILAFNLLKKGTSFSKIARLSTLRFNNAGVLDLVYTAPLRNKGVLHIHLSLIILLSVWNTVMLQFSSTLLLSDLATGSVKTFVNSTEKPIPSDVNPEFIFGHFSADAFLSTSPTYPLFAELTYDRQPQHSENVDDTGPVIRALLPVSANDGRSKLMSFKGNATMYDARVICTQPRFDHLNLTGTASEYNSVSEYSFSGTVNHSVFLPRMASTQNSSLLQFNCSISETQESDLLWTLFTCPLMFSRYEIGLISDLERFFDDKVYETSWSDELDYQVDSGPYYFVPVGASWLVINVTNFNTPSNPPSSLAFDDSRTWISVPKGQWTHLTLNQTELQAALTSSVSSSEEKQDNSGLSFALDASICSSGNLITKSFYIEAKRGKAVDEPTSLQEGIAQIGVSRSVQTHQERGIMTLNETALNNQLLAERETLLQTNASWPVLPVTQLLSPIYYLDDRGAAMASRLWFPDNAWPLDDATLPWRSVSEDRMTLFQTVIQETKSPALAIQSMLHTYMTDRYYKYAPYYTNSTTQWTTFSVDAIRPVRTRGFIAVMTAISVHLILVAYILIVFGISQGTNRAIRSVDQVWQVFAQVAQLQKEMLLSFEDHDYDDFDLTTATDYEVERKLRRCGLKDQIFVLDDDCQDGTMRFKAKSS